MEHKALVYRVLPVHKDRKVRKGTLAHRAPREPKVLRDYKAQVYKVFKDIPVLKEHKAPKVYRELMVLKVYKAPREFKERKELKELKVLVLKEFKEPRELKVHKVLSVPKVQ